MRRKYIATLLLIISTSLVNAQNNREIQIKANMIFLPIAIVNTGIEIPLSQKTSIQTDIFISPWKSIKNHRALFMMGHIEGRYYTKNVYNGWYIGANIGGGIFELTKWNYSGTNKFQRGYNIMIGATVGYKWDITYKWGIDLFLGAGTIQSFYHGYDKLAEKYIYRYEKTDLWNKSGELLPYRGGIMLTYKL